MRDGARRKGERGRVCLSVCVRVCVYVCVISWCVFQVRAFEVLFRRPQGEWRHVWCAVCGYALFSLLSLQPLCLLFLPHLLTLTGQSSRDLWESTTVFQALSYWAHSIQMGKGPHLLSCDFPSFRQRPHLHLSRPQPGTTTPDNPEENADYKSHSHNDSLHF